MDSSNNDARDRKIQQDTRAWAKLAGTNYTTALRQIESPLAQGILGERVSARQLINTLDEHPLIGADDGVWILGEAGFYPEYAKKQWSFNRTSDFIELALITEFLRMFTPVAPGETPTVNSYELKHTAEKFLEPHCSYVTNGRLIWAAAALGLPMVEQDNSINLLIGVSEREHAYVRRIVVAEETPRGHQHRPAGFIHLKTALEQCAADEQLVPARWERPEPSTETFPFHDWLLLQAGRDDVVGDLAGDYVAGIEGSYHGIAVTAQDLLDILRELSAAPEAFDSALEAIIEWATTAPPELRGDMSLRTERVRSNEEATSGWGAGPGTIERHEFLCPCGRGLIIEEHDNTPGFREHDVWIDCDKCRESWHRVPGLSVQRWRVEPKLNDEAA